MTYPIPTIVHIMAGSILLLAGAVALLSKKGGKTHRFAGNLFFVFIIINSIGGAYMAYLAPRMLSVVFGVLAFYLAASSWLTVKNIGASTKVLQFLLFGVALIDGGVGIYLGGEAADAASGTIYEGASGAYYFFGSVALLAVALDLRMFIYGGVSGAHRIIRHLWRMCFAFLLATMAIFSGQQQVFPAFIRDLNILSIPTLLVFLSLIYWVLKVKFSKKMVCLLKNP